MGQMGPVVPLMQSGKRGSPGIVLVRGRAQDATQFGVFGSDLDSLVFAVLLLYFGVVSVLSDDE